MDTILGIDLGTTNSVVSIYIDDKVRVLEEDGQRILPSIVGLDSDGKLLVGYPALNQWTLAPDRTVRSIKRKMGNDEAVKLGEQSYSPQEISAMILRTLKERAARQLGREVSKAVITVPAFFNDQQREATRQAGELAGLEVVRIINEPTAASLTYNSSPEGLERLLVYDLGGGTFDVSIVQIEQGVVEVLSSHGDTHLGGDDFDQLLLDHVCDKFKEEHDIDLRDSLVSKSRVLRAVEEAKKQLSFDPFVSLEEEFIAEKAGVPLHLNMELSRQEYETLIEPLLNKTLVCVDEALSDAKMSADKIDRVILVGGASRTPLVHQMLQDQLGQEIHAEIDPDLCVSMGAAIQGGMIAGVDVGPVLVDITPHTLGIHCLGWVHGFRSHYQFAPLIERNSALPASRSEVFSTTHDGQEVVRISVYQGEDEDVRHNEMVGDFTLEGLADVKEGNQILVNFELDLNGILKVTAREKATGLAKQLTIDNATSRFRKLNQQEAESRLQAVFADSNVGEGTLQVSDLTSDSENLPPEVRQAVTKAQTLLEKSESLIEEATAEDAEEIRQLTKQLRHAIDDRSLEGIKDMTEKLDEIVFYLHDA